MKSRITSTERLARQLRAIKDGLIRPPEYKDGFDVVEYVTNLRIISKRGELVPLAPWPAQEQLLRAFVEAEAAGRIPRFIVLKSRRLGISHIILAYMFARTDALAYRYAAAVAHDMESAQYLFGICKIFYEYLPPDKKKQLLYDSRRQIVYAPPHHSRLTIGTANNERLFSAQLIHDALFDEFAKWSRPESPYTAAAQCIPREGNTLVAIVSTAFGAGNLFQRLWREAEAGANDYTPVFVGHTSHPEYSIPSAQGTKPHLSSDEAAYQQEHDIPDDRMNWVVWTKRNQCHNDWAEFNQEYPITPAVAFKSTGAPYFDLEALSDMPVQAPSWQGYLQWRASEAGEAPEVELIPADAAFPLVSVWETPEEQAGYVIGCDVAEGVGQDFTVAQVFRLPDLAHERIRQVAKLKTNTMNTPDAAAELFKLATWYNTALVGVERNGPGLSLLGFLERGHPEDKRMAGGYPNLYFEEIHDESEKHVTRRMGWNTTRITKPVMLQALKHSIAETSVVLHSLETVEELTGFSRDPEKLAYVQNYRNPASKLYNDDEVMSTAIAQQMVEYALDHRFLRNVRTCD